MTKTHLPWIGTKQVGLLFILAVSLDLSFAIRCFECDEIPGASFKKCPGTNLVRFGRNYDSCIIYRLSSGRIVFQEPVASKQQNNLCKKDPSLLKAVIEENFRGESGTAMCCRSDGCNKDIPSDFEEKSFQNYLEDFRTSPFTGERNNFDSDQRNENDRNFEEGSSLREYRDEDYNGVDTMESSIVVLLSVITCSIVNAISSWRKDL